jgi:hypothetical protein
MNRDMMIILTGNLITIFMLIAFVPRNRIREAQVVFFFKQLITWVVGLAVVEYGLIEYPVRLFSKANKTSFSFEYFIYPAFCVLFNLHYPVEKSRLQRFMYYVYYCSSLTIIEVFVEKHTQILNYIHWEWYVTWITFFITFYLSRKYYLWFFRKK